MKQVKKKPVISKNKSNVNVKKILIVDDQDDDLKSMNQILNKEGYEVLTCKDGTKALETLSKNKVDLILLDVMMPVLSGEDLLKIFRDKLAPNIPIVYVSVKSSRELDLSHADGYVQKPFSPSTLVNKVNSLIMDQKNR